MASSTDYLEFVLDLLRDVPAVTHRNVFVKTVVSWAARKTFRPGTASFRVRQGMPLNAFS